MNRIRLIRSIQRQVLFRCQPHRAFSSAPLSNLSDKDPYQVDNTFGNVNINEANLFQEDEKPSNYKKQKMKKKLKKLVERRKRNRPEFSKFTVSLIGRPNVGKSSLFNKLATKKEALVSDIAGTTRDRREGLGKLGDLEFKLIDTGGLEDEAVDVDRNLYGDVQRGMMMQTEQAILESDLVLFIIDGRDGVTMEDEFYAKWIRRLRKDEKETNKGRKLPIKLIINKAEGMGEGFEWGSPDLQWENLLVDCYKLGFGTPIPMSAEYGQGLGDLYTFLEPIGIQKYIDEVSQKRIEMKHLNFPFSFTVTTSSYLNNHLVKLQDRPDLVNKLYAKYLNDNNPLYIPCVTPEVFQVMKDEYLDKSKLIVLFDSNNEIDPESITSRPNIIKVSDMEELQSLPELSSVDFVEFMTTNSSILNEILSIQKCQRMSILQLQEEITDISDLNKFFDKFKLPDEYDLVSKSALVESMSDNYQFVEYERNYYDKRMPDAVTLEDTEDNNTIEVAIVGRPNVGKSTLLNKLIGSKRCVTGPMPGLTRDAIKVEWQFAGKKIHLIDTAGIRKNSKLKLTDSKEKQKRMSAYQQGMLESLSIERSMRALGLAQVALVLCDLIEDENPEDKRPAFTKQDLTIIGKACDEGRAIIVGANKCDLVLQSNWSGDQTKRKKTTLFRDEELLKQELDNQISHGVPQARGVPVLLLSAIDGGGVANVMPAVLEMYGKWRMRINTSTLVKWLQNVQYMKMPDTKPIIRSDKNSRNRRGGGVALGRVKIKYITQFGTRPPAFALFVNKHNPVGALTDTYLRYLMNNMRESFELHGVPIRMTVKGSRNPFVKKLK